MKSYKPSELHLKRYADILVNVALGSGKGIKKGDVVYVMVPEIARPLAIEIFRSVLDAGGYPIMNYGLSADEEFKPMKELFTRGNKNMSTYSPYNMLQGVVKDVDHLLRIDAPTDLHELADVDQKLVMERQERYQPFRKAYFKKEAESKLTWTIADYGTEAMAKEAGMTLREYWKQIIAACYLDDDEPIRRWKETIRDIKKTITWLNGLEIESVHMTGVDCDITLTIGKNRQWLGGRGANIPSFEVFTSPDWRGTNGWIRFNQPLYRNGVKMEGIKLHFEKGIITKFSATHNQEALGQMIAQKNANKVGEFSLTDKRLSNITRFMASTLYDENMGGPHGNSHIAIGMAYKDAFNGRHIPKNDKEWDKIGMNDSSVHSDIVTTTPRIVTALCGDGNERVIYKDGMFTFAKK